MKSMIVDLLVRGCTPKMSSFGLFAVAGLLRAMCQSYFHDFVVHICLSVSCSAVAMRQHHSSSHA